MEHIVEYNSFIHYLVVSALIVVGMYGMLGRPNLMRKLMAMNIVQVGIIFFFISLAAKSDATAPILWDAISAENIDQYVNPLPHALMLTAIVVGVATTGVALALLIRIRRRFHSIEEPEILKAMMKRDEA